MNLEVCPICQEKLHEIETNEYGCDNCKRVWIDNAGDGWVSKMREVNLKKMPETGDHLSDVIEPLIPKEYTLGFLFSHNKTDVLLIKKNRPVFLNGMLNGIGGRLEMNEATVEGMHREMKEETGLGRLPWEKQGELRADGFTIHIFRAFSDKIYEAHQMSDEEIEVLNVENPDESWWNGLAPHLNWMIPLALSNMTHYTIYE